MFSPKYYPIKVEVLFESRLSGQMISNIRLCNNRQQVMNYYSEIKMNSFLKGRYYEVHVRVLSKFKNEKSLN